MRKTNFMVAMITGALVLACVLSCDNEPESIRKSEVLNKKGETGSRTAVNQSNGGDIVFDGSVGDPIELSVAKKWIANYRSTIENPEQRLSHFFGFEIIQEILGQENCVGIRMYYALDDNGDRQLLLVGVDSNGDDILPADGGKMNDGGGIIGDASFPCPDVCPGIGL